jgi:hypothetical protein
MVPRTPVWKLVSVVVVLIIGAAISIPLGRYAEADDAPGGVLIAGLIMIGSVLFATWIIARGPQPSDRK